MTAAHENIANNMPYIDESIRDIVTEEFLRECAALADAEAALRKQREALWAKIAPKIEALPDLETANKVFGEISYACSDWANGGRVRNNPFAVERSFVVDHFRHGAGSKRPK